MRLPNGDMSMTPPAHEPINLPRYLARIGYDGPVVPTLDVLRALQAAHLAAIPFEALDVLTGKGIDLDAAAVDAKLIDAGRGGYCFEQNGLFLRVLTAIGFDAVGLLARVRWMLPADAPLAARTHQLSCATIDGTAWLVDVGFGAMAPATPLALDREGAQPTAHEPCRVVALDGAWLVEAKMGGDWTPLYLVDPVPPPPVDYVVGNWYTSTHPSSHFRQMLVAARTTAEARYALRDNRLTVRCTDGRVEQSYLTADAIETALAEIFLLPVSRDWRPAIERAAAIEVPAEVVAEFGSER
jgi:N-hydroxyarylamine O-acetyltransferase